jgi:SAM-dependent methyltransferase
VSSNDKSFTGSIPKMYETYLVPLIFDDYAADLARRAAARAPQRVLEIAAGTGVVTRAMLAALPATTEVVATDLNPAMIDQAKAIGSSRAVTWQQADAMQLPFQDGSFDAVVIQFGVMFFPDKAKALGEARRVLRAGGVLLFNVWDRIEDNEAADAITAGLAAFFPSDPPRFLPRAPYGYFDHAAIAQDVTAAGFAAPVIDTLTFRGRAPLASDAAVGYCQGSPLRAEIEARGSLEQATDAAAKEVARRFGSGPIDTKIQAIVVTAVK